MAVTRLDRPDAAELSGSSARGDVVVGFADALSAIESAWSLREAGFGVVAFARRGRPCGLARARAVRIVPVTPPEHDAAGTVSEVAKLVRDLGPVAVLPLDDHAVWVIDRVVAVGVDTPVAGPVGRLAAIALDKQAQLDAALEAGLPVPGAPVAAPGAGEAWPVPAPYPHIVKSALSVVERAGVLDRPAPTVAADAADVAAARRRIGGHVLVQPLLPGVGEGVFGLATESGVRAWSAHRRIRMMNPSGSGASACRSVPLEDELRATVERFVAAIGWRGLFMVELLRDREGRAWMMELNGRPWGSMALARGRGLEYPAWAVRLALDPAFEAPVPRQLPDLTARHLGRELVHLALTTRDVHRHRGLRTGWRRVAGAAAEVLRVRRDDHWYNWRPGEPGVFVADTLATLRRRGS